eukprot:1151050-Pelagomonas_calceolata.AAC.1
METRLERCQLGHTYAGSIQKNTVFRPQLAPSEIISCLYKLRQMPACVLQPPSPQTVVNIQELLCAMLRATCHSGFILVLEKGVYTLFCMQESLCAMLRAACHLRQGYRLNNSSSSELVVVPIMRPPGIQGLLTTVFMFKC